MRVLVTGGGGFLGQWICRQLQARGDSPIAFQRSAQHELEAGQISVVTGDVRDAASVSAAAKGCDAVIHTAGIAGAWGDPAVYRAINLDGTLNVLEACRDHDINRLVFTSSPSVAHGGGDIEGGDESLPYPDHYTAPYPETKALAEQAVMAASNSRLMTVSLRPHLVWGPGDNQLLPRLMERAAEGPLRLPGAHKLIDTVYVENAAAAHLKALDALVPGAACLGRTYFISNGEPWAQARIIDAMLQAAGVRADLRPLSPRIAALAGTVAEIVWKALRRQSEPPITRWSAEQLSTAHWYDITAARRDLGFTPEISINEGLERLRQHFATKR